MYSLRVAACAALLVATGCASSAPIAQSRARTLADVSRAGLLPVLAAELGTGLASLDAELRPEGVERCSGAVFEYGTYTAAVHQPADSAFSRLGRYAVLWEAGDDGPAVPLRVTFHPAESRRAHREPPCRVVSDSLFVARRVWVEVHPATKPAPWHSDLVSALAAAGWQEDSNRQGLPVASDSRLLPGGMIQVSLPGRFSANIGAGGVRGAIAVRNPLQHARQLSYTGYHAGTMGAVHVGAPVLSRARLALAGGPLLIRVNGVWEAAPGGSWDTTPEERWSAHALGAAAEAAFLLPVGSRIGFSARLQQRFLPSAKIAGHLGSDPLGMNFSHRDAFVGFGLKVW